MMMTNTNAQSEQSPVPISISVRANNRGGVPHKFKYSHQLALPCIVAVLRLGIEHPASDN